MSGQGKRLLALCERLLSTRGLRLQRSLEKEALLLGDKPVSARLRVSLYAANTQKARNTRRAPSRQGRRCPTWTHAPCGGGRPPIGGAPLPDVFSFNVHTNHPTNKGAELKLLMNSAPHKGAE